MNVKRFTGRIRRKKRVRQKVQGTPERPRLCVHRSLKHIYAQIIDDTTGHTIASASTLDPEFRGQLEQTGNCTAARSVGRLVGQRARQQGVEKVVFDRGGDLYHGRVKEVAEGARETELVF